MSLSLALLAGARTAHVERHVRPRFSLYDIQFYTDEDGAMSERPFRTADSHLAEQVTRRIVLEFLEERQFRVLADRRVRNGQTVDAITPDTQRLSMRVKLCWRRGSEGRDTARHGDYSAAQLMARIQNDDWLGSIQRKMDRERSAGVTHLLLVQRDGEAVTLAALIPIEVVAEVWDRQRDISERLIKAGRLGRRRKNHAMNGASPTLWLRDDRGGQKVADALWAHPAVSDLSSLPTGGDVPFFPEEVGEPQVFVEGACRRIVVNSYERDRRARWQCIQSHGAMCAACGFDFGKTYGDAAEGFIHVHHIRPLAELGAGYLLDPIADLRPLCPNCHAFVHMNGGCKSIEEVQSALQTNRRE